jgi:hypothetical protein
VDRITRRRDDFRRWFFGAETMGRIAGLVFAFAALSLAPVAARAAESAASVSAAPAVGPTAPPTAPPCASAADAILYAQVTHGYSGAALNAKPSACVRIAIRKPVNAPVDPDGRVWRIATGTAASLELTPKGLVLRYRLPADRYRAKRVIDGVGMYRDDTIAMLVYGAARSSASPPPVAIRAVTNALHKCVTITKSATASSQNQLCKCDGSKPAPGTFEGVLTMTYDQLRQAGVPESFDVGVTLRIWTASGVKGESQAVTYEGGEPGGQRLVHVSLGDHTDFSSQRYSVVSTDLGNHAAGIPRRTGMDIWQPLSRNTLLSATFSDDSAGLLSERQKIVSSVVPDKSLVRAYDCKSCYSFQTNDNGAFQPLLKTSEVVGLDLQSLGLDTVPIDFSSMTSPIDSGWKLISRDDRRTFAVAKFRGATATTTFDDAAYRFADVESGDRSTLRYGVFHVVANHSATPTFGISPRSVTTLASAALTTFDKTRSARDPLHKWTTLVRIGTQYVPDSRHYEFLESLDAQPGLAADNERGEQTATHFAVGYRDVGVRYVPYDAPVDPLGGTHGFFGGVGFDRRVADDGDAIARDRSVKPLSGSVIAHAFGDRAGVRDIALAARFELEVAPSMSLKFEQSSGSVAASVAGRSAGLLISPALGTTLFDNSQTSLSLLSKRAPFAWSVGYQRLATPNCSSKIKTTAKHPLPCDPYRQGSVTAAAFVPLKRDGFLAGSLGNSLAEPFGEAFVSNQTTVTRLKRTIAFGYPVGQCSRIIGVATNRAGDVDQSTQTRDKPGLYLGSFLELNFPKKNPQGILVGFVRNQDFTAGPAALLKQEFFVRVVTGTPMETFGKTMGCVKPDANPA